MEMRDCSVCHGKGCKCCYNGKVPFPWTLPDEKPIHTPWTAEEDALVLGAPTPQTAYDVYRDRYGSRRSWRAVYDHWRYRRTHPVIHRAWSIDEEETIEDATSTPDAIRRYRLEYGDERSDRAIKEKYLRLAK